METEIIELRRLLGRTRAEALALTRATNESLSRELDQIPIYPVSYEAVVPLQHFRQRFDGSEFLAGSSGIGSRQLEGVVLSRGQIDDLFSLYNF
jgi:hypothetical protein